ncbi:hypothetical protein IQ06DRAFT_294251, partial [Phaeosphaeriaceae sp. SRC1lsM3a]
MAIAYMLEKYDIVQLHSGNLALMAKNGCETGDEVWVVLGCHVCITLRPQPSKVYLQSRPAVVPTWEQYENFKRFTEHNQTGDRIEDWIVEDIEI